MVTGIKDKDIKIRKGMYGLPQYFRIAQDNLQKYLAKYDYLPAPITSRMWHHNTRPINFTLVADDSRVKYVGQEHAQYLKFVLESMYKMNIDLEDK